MHEQSFFREINERIVLPVLLALVLISVVAKGVVITTDYVAAHDELAETHASIDDKQNPSNAVALNSKL